MTKLTIDQALQKGIEAHKAGQVQEADRLYTAILQAQPKHPDANHNLGVLAVGVGKVEQALPFFETALETNPAKTQFWLSYIEALIKLDRLADAKASLDQAKNKGANGDGFDKLEKRLREDDGEYCSDNTRTETSETNQRSTLDIAIQLRETGEFNQAIDLLKDGTNQFPEDADILAVLSHCYLLADQIEEAKLYLNKATAIAPDNALVGWNIARLTLKEKNTSEALNIARDTSQRFPDDIEGMGVLGACLRANGEVVESLNVLDRAIELNPNYTEALINRGLIKLSQNNKPEALADLELAHRLWPHAKQIWDFVIGLKIEVQDYSDSILLLINMIEIDPEDEKRLATLALCYQYLEDYESSEEIYNKALTIKPDYAEAHTNLGLALANQGKLEEAIEAFKKSIAIKPDNAKAYNNMGVTLKEQGKLEEAIVAYNKALAIKPHYAEAHRHLSIVTKYNSDTTQINAVETLLRRTDLNDSDRCNLLYTHAKIHEDLGNLGGAFDCYVTGGSLRQKLLSYKFTQDDDLFCLIKQTAPQFKDVALNVTGEPFRHLPIFILGMPRSGTTLVEQIVSSHSSITGAGELRHISQFGGELAAGLTVPTVKTVSTFRERYLAELAKRADGQAFITDKMPQNFRYIALICAAFPEAKIVHVQRSAEATCWSNFKHYFVSESLGYSYNLSDTVKYYGLYRDLMHFWSQSYSDRIYKIDYDKLTENQEPETRRLIEALGLNWEAACLVPQNNKRSVKTASQQQVQQKVYKGSSQGWRKYEPFLNGVFDGFKA